MSEKKVTIYFPGDGTAVIRWPLGVIPDADTVERIKQILNEHGREVSRARVNQIRNAYERTSTG